MFYVIAIKYCFCKGKIKFQLRVMKKKNIIIIYWASFIMDKGTIITL